MRAVASAMIADANCCSYLIMISHVDVVLMNAMQAALMEASSI